MAALNTSILCRPIYVTGYICLCVAYHIKKYEGLGVWVHRFLISARDQGEFSAPWPRDSHCLTVKWLDVPTFGLDTAVSR
jgi:hypothetical protein